jgi:hypothetical protein
MVYNLFRYVLKIIHREVSTYAIILFNSQLYSKFIAYFG